jgi:alpha-ketoglutarate-dependent taurine dioxygenase
VADRVLAALNRHHVLIFPQIHMSDDQFLGLTAAMGEKHDNGVHRDGSQASAKGLFRVARDKDEQVQRDIIRANDFWHMDGMNYAGPVKATMLKCESAPANGGETGFALLHAAYDALPDAKKNQIADLKVGHSIASSLTKVNHAPSADDVARWEAIFPRMERPLVW